MKPLTPVRIYVSGPSRDLERCERAIALCRDLGAEITHDWTIDVRAHAGMSTPEDPDVQRALAQADIDGVRSADAVVFLDGEHASPGRWVEVGAAIGLGIPVIASVPAGCRPYIWHRLMQRATDDHQACETAIARARHLAMRKRRADERASKEA